MAALLITYDLNKPGQDYEGLFEEIKSFGTWWHYLDSTWIVDTNLTVSSAADRIRTKVDSSDHFLVLDITGDASQGWLPKDAWDWINKHV